jgi:3-deoxy-manno-octulosonate cytidylyltransferase (CMP-KDO synthetase)
MTPIILIPARMAAARLPGKPLADIAGAPMIVRVWRQAVAAEMGPVAVAAGDPEIVAAVSAAGGHAVLTDPVLPSGTDRVLAALRLADADGRCDVVVNLQGDMPFIDPAAPRTCADLLAQTPSCDIATLVSPEESVADRNNPNVVKAILAMDDSGARGRALYFTRSSLWGEGSIWRHIGVYAYRRAALERFCAQPPSALERREKLEQLRALEMGMEIQAAVIPVSPLSVDNPADLDRARKTAPEFAEANR